jgi:hypothetical protein
MRRKERQGAKKNREKQGIEEKGRKEKEDQKC